MDSMKQKKLRKQKVQTVVKNNVVENVGTTTLDIENNVNKQKPKPTLGIEKLLTKVKNA